MLFITKWVGGSKGAELSRCMAWIENIVRPARAKTSFSMRQIQILERLSIMFHTLSVFSHTVGAPKDGNWRKELSSYLVQVEAAPMH